MIRAIIFDFYDVIHFGTLQSWLANYRLERCGEVAEIFDLVDKNQISRGEFYQRLATLAGISASEAQKTFEVEGTWNWPLIKVIHDLKKNYKLGLLSNADGQYLRDLLAQQRLDQLFEAVIASSEVGLVKPEAEIFKLILNELNSAPEQTLFIDDTDRHIQSASALGIHTILYKNIQNLKLELAKLGVKT